MLFYTNVTIERLCVCACVCVCVRVRVSIQRVGVQRAANLLQGQRVPRVGRDPVA